MTAVEYLVKKYFEDYNVLISELEFQQAIEMEKKDILYFGAKCCVKTTEKKSWTLEELYNETFKNK